MTGGIEIVHYKPVQKGALRGIAKVKMPSGLIMAEVQVLEANGKFWANPPSKPLIDRDGNHLRDDRGRPRYTPLVDFESRQLRDKFSNGVIAALRAQKPEAFR